MAALVAPNEKPLDETPVKKSSFSLALVMLVSYVAVLGLLFVAMDPSVTSLTSTHLYFSITDVLTAEANVRAGVQETFVVPM